MAKAQEKKLINKKSPINYTSDTLKEYGQPVKKSVQQLNKEHYQKNKQRIKEKQKERYQQQKDLTEKQEREQLSKYYGTEAIKILMTFKEYTELNKEKKQLWLDFNWTFQDCQKSFKEGYADIVAIMKLEQISHNLIKDFWETAKSEARQKGKSWNSLEEEEQQRLIRYWSYEKARIENVYLDEKERLEKQSWTYLKAIEIAKFHEERGKIKCKCYQCEQKEKIQGEIKQKWKKELEDYERSEKVECPNCGRKVKELDEENDVCRKCMESYED